MRMEVKDCSVDAIIDNYCVLTPREIEYLGLVALGYHNNEIARTLYVSFYTVKKTLENIFDKLHAIDRANAVAIVFIHKILNVAVLTDLVQTYKISI